MNPSTTPVVDLDAYIQFLFEGLDGYAYLVAKEPGKKDADSWHQGFYEYPAQAQMLRDDILSTTAKHEVYISPVLYKTDANARRENVKVTNVVWTEFDGNAPTSWEEAGATPSLTVRSSLEGHNHVYWKLDNPLTDVNTIEHINRSIQFNFSADSSAWDATQVLRPPSTYNHKRSRSVTVLETTDVVYEVDSFATLAPPPEIIRPNQWTLAELPEVSKVILRYPLTEDLVLLLHKEQGDVKDRSASLMQAAFAACQLGMSDVEVFVVVKHLADQWKKFDGRRDKDQRLADIVAKARVKYPDAAIEPTEDAVQVFSFKTFLEVEVNVDWVIEGVLMQDGNMLVAGPSGVGKTQWSLQWMIHLALGKDYMGHRIPKPMRVGFLSLEMGIIELQAFVANQRKDLNEAEVDLLDQNLFIIPRGESLALNEPSGQAIFEQFVDQYELQMMFVDSVGSAIVGNINSQEVVQGLTNFNDKMRNTKHVNLWYIHHTRKAAPGQKGQTNQDDVYGDQYLVNRATSVIAVEFGKDDSIKITNWKNRMAKKFDRYFLRRTEHINFEKVDVSTGKEDAQTALTNYLKESTNEKVVIETAGGFAEI